MRVGVRVEELMGLVEVDVGKGNAVGVLSPFLRVDGGKRGWERRVNGFLRREEEDGSGSDEEDHPPQSHDRTVVSGGEME